MKAFGLWAVLACVGVGGSSYPMGAIANPVKHLHETETVEAKQGFELKPGSNEMLRAPMSLADGLEVIVSDVIIPPNATVPRHFHPGEEFIYLIEGSVVNVVEGLPDTIMRAGETFVMPPGVAHAPYATDEGARAIVFRVHVEGRPERYLVETEAE